MSQRKAPSSPGKAGSLATTTTEVRSDDADLEDLLGHSNGAAPPPNSAVQQVAATQAGKDKEERVPLVGSSSIASNLKFKEPNNDDDDELLKSSSEKAALERKRFLQQQRASATGFSYHPEQGSCLQYCTAYASLICYYHPWVCSSIAVGIGIALMLALVNAVFNPVGTYGVLPHDHSNIHSKYDLSMNKIDHWCLGGGNENCLCEGTSSPHFFIVDAPPSWQSLTPMLLFVSPSTRSPHAELPNASEGLGEGLLGQLGRGSKVRRPPPRRRARRGVRGRVARRGNVGTVARTTDPAVGADPAGLRVEVQPRSGWTPRGGGARDRRYVRAFLTGRRSPANPYELRPP
jgi:hypothetical protein